MSKIASRSRSVWALPDPREAERRYPFRLADIERRFHELRSELAAQGPVQAGRGAGERVGGPLFTGEVRHWRVGAEDDFSLDQYGLRLSLSLNPTRYVAHQQSRPFAGLPVAEWALPAPAMYRRRTVRATRLETILDDNDNVLLTGAARAHGQPAAWPVHLQRYWGGVTAEIDAAFADAAVRSGSMVQRVAENLNLRLVERGVT
jgi:hypothetical protein